MKTYLLLLALGGLLLTHPVHAQYSVANAGLIGAAEFSKEQALYQSKAYIIKRLGAGPQPKKFQAFALAAATSGELTTLVYSSTEDAQKSGLLLAFYGNYFNEQGVRYQGYAFKEFSKTQAEELMGKLEGILKTSALDMVGDMNNLYFSYEDVTFLLYSNGGVDTKVRVMWGPFDSEWNVGALHRTASRMVKKI